MNFKQEYSFAMSIENKPKRVDALRYCRELAGYLPHDEEAREKFREILRFLQPKKTWINPKNLLFWMSNFTGGKDRYFLQFLNVRDTENGRLIEATDGKILLQMPSKFLSHQARGDLDCGLYRIKKDGLEQMNDDNLYEAGCDRTGVKYPDIDKFMNFTKKGEIITDFEPDNMVVKTGETTGRHRELITCVRVGNVSSERFVDLKYIETVLCGRKFPEIGDLDFYGTDSDMGRLIFVANSDPRVRGCIMPYRTQNLDYSEFQGGE